MKSILTEIKKHTPNQAVQTIAFEIDQERLTTLDLLKQARNNVGMLLGELIESQIASMEGRHFNPVGYHYEKPNGEQ